MASSKIKKPSRFSSYYKGSHTRSVVIAALAAILFGAGSVWAQGPGYILKNNGETHHATVDAANPQSGNTLTIYDGDVPMGGNQITYASPTGFCLTVQSDSDIVRTINGSGSSRFTGAFTNDAGDVTLNLTNVTLANFKVASSTGGVIYQSTNAQSTTLNGSNATFSGNSATSGGVFDGYDITINGSNAFSGNSATGTADNSGYGGVLYTSSAVIRGTNTFTNNTATNAGGAIRAHDVTFAGNGSSATFSGNKANGANNDLSITGFAEGAVGSVTIQDAGTYLFGGGITAAAENTGNYHLSIKDGANVTFGKGSVTNVTGNVFLDNASLTIKGGTDTTFKAAGWAPSMNDSSAVTFVHTVDQAGTVVTGDADKLNTMRFAPIVQLTGDVAANQFGYVNSISDTGVTTTVATGGTFNMVRGLANIGNSATLSGSYGGNSIASGDIIVVTADGKAGGELSFNSSTTLTISSNEAGENRTIDAEGTGRFFNLPSSNPTNSILALHSQDITYQNGKVTNETSSGGAIYAANQEVTLSGTTAFIGNCAGTGGAIHANKATFSGTTTFSGNTAEINGGAISISDLTLSGTNTFENNTAAKRGGAIIAYDATLSGTNTFTGNTVTSTNSYGGAIYADHSVVLSGSNAFSGNSANDNGGAIYVTNGSVTFSGDGSEATFSGNQVGNDTDGWTNNDVYVSENVTIQDKGTYSFGGGIVTESNGNLIVKDGADATLESGSVTNLGGGLKLSGDGTKLNVSLNVDNVVDSNTVTTFNDGATRLTVSGTNSITGGAGLNYTIDTANTTNGWFLGAVGNFAGLDNSISVTNQADYAKFVKTVNANGVWFGALNYGTVYRYDKSGELQNTADTFDGAFGNGLQALATGDSVRIGGDVNSENAVTVGAGVTELSITSAATGGVPVTITATGDDHRFLTVDGDLTLNLTNVGFTGGNALDEYGGAIYAADGTSLTINADNARFTNNTAANGGGVVEANDLVLTGSSSFTENTASNGDGGAIDIWTGTISGTHTFTNNSTVFRGGAVWAQELTFSGDDSNMTFTGNTANETANDIWISNNNEPGVSAPSLTISDDGTYWFGGGIVVKNGGTFTVDDAAAVAFESGAINQITGLTTINSNNVTFTNSSNTFAGGLVVGAGVDQAVGGNVTVGNVLGVTYDSTNETMSQISFADASDLTVNGGTAAAIYDTTGTALSAKDLRGKFLGNTTLIVGKFGGSELNTLDGAGFYESLVYKVQIGYGLDDSNNYVMKSETKGVDFDGIEKNAPAAHTLFGDSLFDVATVEDARNAVNGATGELFASNATAQVQRLSYLHRMIVGRVMDDTDPQYEGSLGHSILRGQDGDVCGSCQKRPVQIWASGYGIGGYAHWSHNLNGYDYKAGGMLIGADWDVESVKAGMFYGYGQTNIDAVQSSLDGKDHTFGGYAQWDSRLFGGYTTALGTFSFSDNDGARWYADTAFADHFSSWQGATYIEKGWKYINPWCVNVNPYGALQYIGYSADETTDAALQIGEVNYDSLHTVLGLRLDRDFYRSGRVWNFSTGTAWHHELLDTSASFIATANFGGAPVSAEIFGSGAGRDWVEYTVGADVAVTERLTLSADYYLYINAYSALNAGMGTLSYTF